MGQGDTQTPDGIDPVAGSQPALEMDQHKAKEDISHVERVLSPDDLQKEDMDFSRVDKEIQMYASRGRVEIDEATNKRLKRMIDRRVLVVMIATYVIQALDKGTMSFSSIMGIKTDAHLEDGQKVRRRCISEQTKMLTTVIATVLMAHHLYLHCGLNSRIPDQLDYSTRSCRKISGYQYLSVGVYLGDALARHELYKASDTQNTPGYIRSLLSAHISPSVFNVVQARGASSYCYLLVSIRCGN